MALIENGNLIYTVFDSFSEIDFVSHGLSTRHGGVSSGIYESMNLSFTIGDTEENVYNNYKAFAKELGFNYNEVQRGYQVHGTNVEVVTRENMIHLQGSVHFKDTDALITNEKNIPLSTFYADCVPVFFVDKKNHAIGVAHAGWRGTADNIVKNVVIKMRETFGTNPEDLICGIGQSIHECCFLVDDDVYEVFNEHEEYRAFIKKDENKYKINLQEINKKNLMDQGVLEKNIEISPYCTACNEDLFFSHRRQGLNRGTMGGFIQISK